MQVRDEGAGPCFSLEKCFSVYYFCMRERVLSCPLVQILIRRGTSWPQSQQQDSLSVTLTIGASGAAGWMLSLPRPSQLCSFTQNLVSNSGSTFPNFALAILKALAPTKTGQQDYGRPSRTGTSHISEWMLINYDKCLHPLLGKMLPLESLTIHLPPLDTKGKAFQNRNNRQR